MLQLKIWEKYTLKRLLKLFFLIVSSFYALYILIDYSSHFKSFGAKEVPFGELLLFYTATFFKRIEILFPFCALIAATTTLTRMNQRRELVALLAGGVSKKRILAPFLIFSILCTSVLYINFEVIEPLLLPQIDRFENTYLQKRNSLGREETSDFKSFLLTGGEKVYYRYYIQHKNVFEDVFIIYSQKNIFQMELLKRISSEQALGTNVNCFLKSDTGVLSLQEYHQELVIPNFSLEEKAFLDQATPAENFSISQLFFHIFADKKLDSTRRMFEIKTMACFKLVAPLICFWAVFLAGINGMNFGRQSPIFFSYALQLACIVLLFTTISAGMILGENGVISPFISVCGTFFVFSIPITLKIRTLA